MDTGAESMEALVRYLEGSEGMVISYSGGLDSTFLAVLAHESTGGQAICVLLDSPLIPRSTVKAAKNRADLYGIPCDIVPFPILEDDGFRANTPARCYLCKKRGAALLWKKAAEYGFRHVVDGVNCSDYREWRPGIQASDEECVLHPLASCGFTKSMIRDAAHRRGFSFRDLPSSPCLATRIRYGEEITVPVLKRIEDTEDFLAGLGFHRVRVRVHGNLARIEIPEDSFTDLITCRDRIIRKFHDAGFLYCTFDLEGIRTGSMDKEIVRHLPGESRT